MPITEEQYEKIIDKLNSGDFERLTRLAYEADTSGLDCEMDRLRDLARDALDYSYGEETHAALMSLFDGIETILFPMTEIFGAMEAIERILGKAEDVLMGELFADELEEEFEGE